MNLLALDTSTNHAAVVVATTDGVVHAAAPDPTQRHGCNLIPVIRDLLREANLNVADLDGVAVGLGPGSYTGLRIGLTAAKTLAYTMGKPLVGLDSLEVIAHAPGAERFVSVIADAQRGDLYVANFARPEPDAPLVRTTPTRIESQAAWAAGLTVPTLVLGPGLERFTAPWPEPARTAAVAMSWPDGGHLILLARDVWATGRRDDPLFLEPAYLRRSAAEEQWERKQPVSHRSVPSFSPPNPSRRSDLPDPKP